MEHLASDEWWPCCPWKSLKKCDMTNPQRLKQKRLSSPEDLSFGSWHSPLKMLQDCNWTDAPNTNWWVAEQHCNIISILLTEYYLGCWGFYGSLDHSFHGQWPLNFPSYCSYVNLSVDSDPWQQYIGSCLSSYLPVCFLLFCWLLDWHFMSFSCNFFRYCATCPILEEISWRKEAPKCTGQYFCFSGGEWNTSKDSFWS